MSTQVKVTNSPSGDYVVIDNGTPGASTSGVFPGAASPNQTTNWLGIQADGSCQNFDSTSGATAQGTNPQKNGSIPDYIANGATTVVNLLSVPDCFSRIRRKSVSIRLAPACIFFSPIKHYSFFQGLPSMADTNVDIKSDASGNTVRFRSSGSHPLPPSAGKPVTATGVNGTAATATNIHGEINFGGVTAPRIVFDNPA